MTELTANELAILRNPRYRLKRYLSLCPRDVVFACEGTINVTRDSQTIGFVGLEIGTVLAGSYGNVEAGMTVDIGTTPYGKEYASLRVRKAAASTEIYIAETGGGDINGQGWSTGKYYTVRNERRIWPKLPYMEKTASTDYYDSFDYTIDYDVAYSDQTDNYPPIVNITGDMAGFIDESDLSGGDAESSFYGTASASSEYTFAPASGAFDDNTGTRWATDTGTTTGWLQMSLTESRYIGKVGIICTGSSDDTPRNVDIQYASTSGGPYNTIASQTIEAADYSGGTEVVIEFTPTAAQFWRINITSTNPNSGLRVYISEFNLYDFGAASINYRTVALSAADSEAVADGATISSYLWDIKDGAYASGSSTSATITARFGPDITFRYISCTVTDSNATSSTRYYPIWVHDTAHPPLPGDIGFQISRDETSMLGREMDITIFGNVDAATNDVIPEGTLACYWEEISFDGTDAPTAYRNQFMGWVMRDSTRLSLGRDTYILTVSGPGHWLQQMRGFPISFLERTSPSEWYHMANPTNDRAIATILRYFTTFLDLCGMHQSDRADEWHQPTGSDYAAIKVERANVWEQVTMMAAEYAGNPGIDTHGDLWLTRHPCLRMVGVDDDRDANDTLLSLTPADRDDGTTLDIPEQHYKPYGVVQVDTFYFNSLINVPLRAKAPGRAPGYGAQDEIRMAMVIPGTSAASVQLRLQNIAGQIYAWLNDPVKNVPYQLASNLDVGEPARMEWISVTDNDNLRGLALSSTRFLIDRVSIAHSFDPGSIPKRITWYINKETSGKSGAAITVPITDVIDSTYYEPDDWYPDSWQPDGTQQEGQWIAGSLDQIAGINTDGYLYVTNDFTETEPTWARTDMALDGTPIAFCVDAFSTGYLGTGTAVDGWVLCEDAIYKVSDIFGTPTVAKQFNFVTSGVNGTEIFRNIDASFAEDGFAIVMTHYENNGTYACVTTDGTNWTESAVTTHTETDTDYQHYPGIYVSSKTAGYALTAAFTATGSTTAASPSCYETTNHGSSWALKSGFQLYAGLGSTFVAPWQNNSSDTVEYYNRKYTFGGYEQTYDLYKRDGAVHTDISPATDVGTRVQRFGIASAPTNRNYLAVIGQKAYTSPPYERYGFYTSTNEGSSWTTRQTIDSNYKGRHVAISGANEQILYVWGASGYIVYSTDFGANMSDKSGNLGDFTSPTVGEFVGICGGVT